MVCNSVKKINYFCKNLEKQFMTNYVIIMFNYL